MTLRAGLVALVMGASVLAPASASAQLAPLPEAGRYIVVLDDRVADALAVATQHARAQGGILRHVYQTAIKGYSVELPAARAEAIRRLPFVTMVEPDGVATTMAVQTNPPSWGLDRIDQRPRSLDSRFNYDATGAGVTAYILDTGIRYTHTDFGGRAVPGFDAFGGNGSDCHGHGTHVAGTVGGAAHGVAKQVKLVSVRVLDCRGSGSWSGIIAGVDWVTQQHLKGGPSVANMSLGGGASSSVDTAVRNSIAAGVQYALAAGNDNRNACNYSPARVTEGITVGATTSSDARASYSNYGSCIDFFAPGSSIRSTYHSSDTSTASMSGTSMAAPHVAGAAAQYLQVNPLATALVVRNALYDATTKGVVSSSSSANNHLLYTGPESSGSSTATPTPTPTVTPTPTPTASTSPSPTPSPAPVWSVIENTHSAVSYASSWSRYSSSRASGGNYHRSHTTGATVTYSFHGTGVRWIGTLDRYAGITAVRIDDGPWIDRDAYASSTAWQQILFERTGLARGQHTITLQVTGRRNPSARANRTFFDAFQVLP